MRFVLWFRSPFCRSLRTVLLLTVLFAFALLLCQLSLQLSLIGSQAAVHLLLLLQLQAKLRHAGAKLGAPKHAGTEQSWGPPKTAQVRTVYQEKHGARVQRWEKAIGCVRCCATYFFSRVCLSLVISETRCSRLSQRSRVSLNLAFMLFTWMDKVSRKSH